MGDGERAHSILVVDNGTQYGKLYVKRLRDLGVEVDYESLGTYEEDGRTIIPELHLADVQGFAGLVIAGGKSSVTVPEEQRIKIDPHIYSEFENPILGTCFGHQDMADRLGGEVEEGLIQCGPVYAIVDLRNPFFSGLDDESQRVNATHKTGVRTIPEGFKAIAKSQHALTLEENIDAMYKEPDQGKNDWRIGTQFHPETFLTENGDVMLVNFLGLCGLTSKKVEEKEKRTPNIDALVQEQYKRVREMIGDKPVFLPISGGVDSTVATSMLLEAGIKKEQIHAFHIDTGFNRLDESKEVVAQYHAMGWDFVELFDRKEFFADFSLDEENLRDDLQGKGFGSVKLKDAVYSEHKRYLFQIAYKKVFWNYMESKGLSVERCIAVQGTNQADKVESGKGGGKHKGSDTIKSHHNVDIFEEFREAGTLLEPMEWFFKSDIYHLAQEVYKLPEFFSTRKPFPGPGLLIRIGNHDMVETGMYTEEDIEVLGVQANSLANICGVNVYMTSLEAVGTCGDERAEGVISVLFFDRDHEETVLDNIDELRYVAGQLPHYTTLDNKKCITRFITPLFEIDSTGKYTELKNEGETVEYLQIFDDEVNKIVDELGIKMTQTVNYVISDNLGEEGKYTFVFRPWLAPDLMSGIPLIPGDGLPQEIVPRLKELKDKYDWIGNICLDLTYKPIGGTEIN